MFPQYQSEIKENWESITNNLYEMIMNVDLIKTRPTMSDEIRP